MKSVLFLNEWKRSKLWHRYITNSRLSNTNLLTSSKVIWFKPKIYTRIYLKVYWFLFSLTQIHCYYKTYFNIMIANHFFLYWSLSLQVSWVTTKYSNIRFSIISCSTNNFIDQYLHVNICKYDYIKHVIKANSLLY